MNQPDQPRLLVGVMSGTSLDGVDVAFVDAALADGERRYALRAFSFSPYDARLRKRLLAACAGELPMREAFELHVDLGEVYADAIREAARQAGIDPEEIDAIGLHGQTVYHAPRRAPNGVTVQIGSPAVVAEALGRTVVADFRSADVAAGGEGAPLVPYCDRMLYADPRLNRVALNIGGIANITWLPAGGAADDVTAFDTGPGNALIDAAMRELKGVDYDADGELAAGGKADGALLEELLSDPYFPEPPPKSSGRERFGEERGREIAQRAVEGGMAERDVIATLTLLTARSIANGIRDHAAKGARIDEVIVGGGGARNATLMKMLAEELPGTAIATCDDYGISSDAKEAFCFALLADAALRNDPNVLPSVTGARRAVIGGAIWRT